MAWRVIETNGERWNVHPAAEMRANVRLWQLMLSFRSADVEREPRTLWAAYPMESSSRSSLFQAADRLSDDALRNILAQHIS